MAKKETVCTVEYSAINWEELRGGNSFLAGETYGRMSQEECRQDISIEFVIVPFRQETTLAYINTAFKRLGYKFATDQQLEVLQKIAPAVIEGLKKQRPRYALYSLTEDLRCAYVINPEGKVSVQKVSYQLDYPAYIVGTKSIKKNWGNRFPKID